MNKKYKITSLILSLCLISGGVFSSVLPTKAETPAAETETVTTGETSGNPDGVTAPETSAESGAATEVETGSAVEPEEEKEPEVIDEPEDDPPAPPEDEEEEKKPAVIKKKPVGWKKKKHSWYYLDAKKKPYKGMKKIGKRTYLFSKKGEQLTGWIAKGGKYYFFRLSNGKGGYMVTGKTVNGIKLTKSGTANVTSGNKAKLDLLIRSAKIVRNATKPDDSKAVKLQKIFRYTLKNYRYHGSPTFTYSSDWDVRYANYMMTNHQGSCYHYGAVFAYLGNAVGYKSRAVSSGGHGWAEVDGKITDPAWQLVDGKRHSYYQIDPSLSGVDGRPGYTRARKYIRWI